MNLTTNLLIHVVPRIWTSGAFLFLQLGPCIFKVWRKINQLNAFFNHIFRMSTRSYRFRRFRSAMFREPKVISPKLCVFYVISAKNKTRYTPCISCFNFSTYDVENTQFRRDHFGIPEDVASEAPKPAGASWYSKYMVEKCISLVFLF
jgi:hypothetical protein